MALPLGWRLYNVVPSRYLTHHAVTEIQTKEGHLRWIRHFCKPIIAEDGTHLGNRGANIDVSEEKRVEEQLVHNSLYDSLTGLANRDLFMDRLSQVIKRCEREDFQYAVLFLDLDRFKNINDSLGHRIGDLLLKSIALRLRDECRPADTVARLGGDGFAALLEGVNGLVDALMFAQRIKERVRQPYRLENYEIFTSVSVGVTMSHGTQRSADDLLRDADTAMYHAKSMGRDQIEVFDTEMHERAVERLNLENYLRRAIDRTFIARMMHSEEDHMIVHTIIDLARNLGMNCIVEGVETEPQFKEFKQLGCDQAQGLLFSKPLSAEQAWRLISDNDSAVSSSVS